MNQITSKNRNVHRNYGIDLLRLVAAFYVVILHTMNIGGLYGATVPHSYQDLLCKGLLVVSFCAVNIFGIISGYVGYREPLKKFSYAGYLPLWLTVVFYTVLSAAVYKIVLPDTVTSRDFGTAFFPLTNHLFWYFSAYTLVYFLSPFLNKILYHSSERELKLLFVLLCCVFIPMEYISQPFAMDGGYSALWLLLLYLIGGIMKKLKIGSRLSVPASITAILIIDICLFYMGLNYPKVTIFSLHLDFDIRNSYIAPFYFATAILHVILFSKLRICTFGQKAIGFAAPAAFSVYIANTSPLFFKNFMDQRFVSWAGSSPVGILARTILFSLGFVFIVIIIDFFRQKLFCLLGVQKLSLKLSNLLMKDTGI